VLILDGDSAGQFGRGRWPTTKSKQRENRILPMDREKWEFPFVSWRRARRPYGPRGVVGFT
jgi:hypothetical protein